MVPAGAVRTWWITALTHPPAAPYVGLARRGRQDRGTRDHIKDPRSAAGRFGRFIAATAAVSPRRTTWPARRDVIGIPVSILSSGRRSSRPRTVDDRCVLEARCPPRPTPLSRPVRSTRRARSRRSSSRRRLAALAAAVRAPDGPRARGRDRPRLGPGRPRRRGRGPGRDPVRGAPRLAGRDGAGPRRAVSSSGGSAAGSWSCSRAASTCTRATTLGWSSSRCCCSSSSGPGSWS